MKQTDLVRAVLNGLMALSLSSCAATQPSLGMPNATTQNVSLRALSSASPIQHIVVLVQEDRTYNDLFVTTKTGCEIVGTGKHAHAVKVALKEVPLAGGKPLVDDYLAYTTAYNHGTGCGFNLINHEGLAPYKYVNPADIQPYIKAAANYVLADHMFQTQGSGDFTAHQDLIRGGTEISQNASIIDSPSSTPWGCDAPPGTRTNLITTHRVYEQGKGPFPCLTYKTLADLLDAKSIFWRYYAPSMPSFASNWNAFLAIKDVWENPRERKAHISSPETNILRDISDGTLAPMSWVIPDLVNSDLPGTKGDTGPQWVSAVVNAIGESKYWNSTAIIVVWDAWGGFYDPVPPPFNNQGGFGYRVPAIVIAPYAPQGEVSHTVYSFGSIVRFIEDTWDLGRLGTTDESSISIGNVLDYHQTPRAFVSI